MSLLSNAENILRREGRPLRAEEITQRLIDGGLWTPKMKTPVASVGAAIYSAIKKGKTSVVQTAKATFAIGGQPPAPPAPPPPVQRKAGFVYILVNDFLKGLVKIGMTASDPKRRARELSGTGLPAPFKVYAYLQTSRYVAVEDLVHRILTKLTKRRVNQNREFYKIKPREALEILTDVSRVLDPEDCRIVEENPEAPRPRPVRPVKPVGEPWTGKTALAKIIARRGGNEGAFGGLLLLFSRKRRCVKNGKWRQLLSDAGLKFDENDFVIDWRAARNPL